jgi:hypothetical protein
VIVTVQGSTPIASAWNTLPEFLHALGPDGAQFLANFLGIPDAHIFFGDHPDPAQEVRVDFTTGYRSFDPRQILVDGYLLQDLSDSIWQAGAPHITPPGPPAPVKPITPIPSVPVDQAAAATVMGTATAHEPTNVLAWVIGGFVVWKLLS